MNCFEICRSSSWYTACSLCKSAHTATSLKSGRQFFLADLVVLLLITNPDHLLLHLCEVARQILSSEVRKGPILAGVLIKEELRNKSGKRLPDAIIIQVLETQNGQK